MKIGNAGWVWRGLNFVMGVLGKIEWFSIKSLIIKKMKGSLLIYLIGFEFKLQPQDLNWAFRCGLRTSLNQ